MKPKTTFLFSNRSAKNKKDTMYLSKQIEAMAQRKKDASRSLVKKNYSSGIFQNYTQIEATETRVTAQKQLRYRS